MKSFYFMFVILAAVVLALYLDLQDRKKQIQGEAEE